MNTNNILQQYESIWGKGCEFDVTLSNDGGADVGIILTWLHKPESLSDEEKIKLFDKLSCTSLHMKAHNEVKARFLTVTQSLLSEIIQSTESFNQLKTNLLINMLIDIVNSGEVSESIELAIKEVLDEKYGEQQ